VVFFFSIVNDGGGVSALCALESVKFLFSFDKVVGRTFSSGRTVLRNLSE
jgi:hypothetical protein